MPALMDIWHFAEGTPAQFMKLSFIPLKLYTNVIGIMGKLDNQASILNNMTCSRKCIFIVLLAWLLRSVSVGTVITFDWAL